MSAIGDLMKKERIGYLEAERRVNAMTATPATPPAEPTYSHEESDITGNAVFYAWFIKIWPQPKSRAQKSNWKFKYDMAHAGWCAAAKQELDLAAQLARADARVAWLQQNYNELIMAVARKFPDETRHQTALRYIRGIEIQAEGVGTAAALTQGGVKL